MYKTTGMTANLLLLLFHILNDNFGQCSNRNEIRWGFFYYVLGGIWIVPLNNQYMVQRSVEIKKKHAPVFIQL